MISSRKDDHIKYALKQNVKENDFDLINLDHFSLSNLRLEDINLETDYLNFKSSYPFYINAMTGGSEKGKKINEKLALIAKEFNIPFVLGSQSAAIKDDSLVATYKVARDLNPEGYLVANVSANATVNEAIKAIEMIKANAISIHINIIQELVMSEGDRDFTKWQQNIKKIADSINIPIVVKEVGFGMSKETILKLKELNIKNIDVSGKGGTNFALIERNRINGIDNLFDDLGISTVNSLLNAKDIDDINVFASGGIRNALDIFKALTLGAKAVGLSGYFLRLTELDFETQVSEVNKLILNLKKLFIIFNKKTMNDF